MTVSVLSWRLWLLVALLMSCAAAVAAGFTYQHMTAQSEVEASQREAAEERIARVVRGAISDDFNGLAEALAKENQDARKSQAALLADIRAGVRGLYVPVRLPDSGGSAAAVAGGDRHEARAELAPEAAGVLLGVADEGDEGIRTLNSCIDAYNDARRRLAGIRQQ